MSNDISLAAVTAVPASSNAVAVPKTAASDLPQPSAAAPKPSLIVNPTLRLDAALGLVVIEFRNDSGAITTSIPSQRQLEAYQRWQVTQQGSAPARHTSDVTQTVEPPATTEPAKPTSETDPAVPTVPPD